MGNINESASKKCSEYETQLKEVLDEHGSARMITQILQKELFTYTSYTAGELRRKTELKLYPILKMLVTLRNVNCVKILKYNFLMS